ncbi:MAG: UPF0434 protein [Rhodomicrobium sp.]|nr:MAG: UPF0434 protein [Rhodomicrobium sp.]
MTKADPKQPGSTIDEKLLALLVCPLTKAPLIYNNDSNELISKTAKLAYPIHNGIPVMIPSEARDLSDEELKAL